MKSKELDFTNLDAVEVYKMRLDGTLGRFPLGFWSSPVNTTYAKACTIHMIENILGWNKEDIKKKVRHSTFTKHKLGGMMSVVFGDCVYDALTNAYPDTYEPWELPAVPRGYWTEETGKLATAWLIKKLRWSFEEVKKNIRISTFEDNGLSGMLAVLYRYSPYEALNALYPGKIKPWQLSECQNGYWCEKTGILATRWLILEQLKWTKEEVCQKLTVDTFYDNDLGGMLAIVFGYSIYRALNAAFPDEYLPRELRTMPAGYWVEGNCRSEMKKLFHEELKWDKETCLKNATQQFFAEHNLMGMLASAFDGSPYKAIRCLYPDIKPWQMRKVGRWDDELAIEAIRWIVEEVWKLDELTKVPRKVAAFKEHGLGGMLSAHFGCSIQKALDLAYPTGKIEKSVQAQKAE